VYYVPLLVIYNQCTLPTVFVSFPLIRNILIRERITVVHGHSSILHAATLGLRAVFTDHSLFGFADASAIITNKLLCISLAYANHVICVSHTGKENTVLRASVPPARVSVIPNAVETSVFYPDLAKKPSDQITIVVVSRLVYRKGVDLMAGVIPVICSRHPNVQFIIAGDGPKRLVIEEVRERHRLQERIIMLGAVDHVMVLGDIFLNASLTEAFCMAIVEACACGSTGDDVDARGNAMFVGGLLEGLENAIENHRQGKVVPAAEAHARVAKMYQWENVALRTERVYDAICHEPPLELHRRLDSVMASRGTYRPPKDLKMKLIDEAVDFPAPLPKEELRTNVNKKKIHEGGAS
ncbi:hypothetical protein HPB47_011392, partial [Ixodes persulcatus]